MIKLVKVEDEIKPNPRVGDYKCCYKLEKDNQGIGYGTINKDQENQVFIFIDREQRGNGYGKILFSKILDETKNMGYEEVKITFGKDNEPMLKITKDNNGKQISEDEDSVKYTIEI